MSETEAARRLRIFLERIERLQEERATLADDIAEVFKELVDDGYDKEAAKVVLKIRKNADALTVWQERSDMVDLYLSALGMIAEKLPAPAPARTREIIEHFPPSSAPTSSPVQADESPALDPLPAPGSPHHVSEGPKSRPDDAAASFTQQSSSPRQERQSAQERSSDRSGGQFGDAPKPATLLSQIAAPHADHAQTDDAVPSGDKSTATISDEDVPAFLLKDRPNLRPLCLNPEECAGYGTKTCHRCLTAAGRSEVAA